MEEVARFLNASEGGDAHGAAQLLPLVYEELKRVAAREMAGEAADHTLDATALVHEAYLRLSSDQRFHDRAHFFAAAAVAMRRILIDHARSRGRLKRGGDRMRIELLDRARAIAEDPELLISLNELLARLESEDAPAARVANLHLFGGLSVQEAGAVLQMSRAVAYRNWKYARAWLRDALQK